MLVSPKRCTSRSRARDTAAPTTKPAGGPKPLSTSCIANTPARPGRKRPLTGLKTDRRTSREQMEQHEFTNQLIHESSPYLRQHAHNPVDWYPWGEEAFAKARAENKPVLLSV